MQSVPFFLNFYAEEKEEGEEKTIFSAGKKKRIVNFSDASSLFFYKQLFYKQPQAQTAKNLST